MTISPLPKCQHCGVHLTTFREIIANNRHCEDCSKKKSQWVTVVYVGIVALILHLIARFSIF